MKVFLNFFHEILWIFSKWFTAGRISRSLILEKISIFLPKFGILPKFMKMVWWSNIHHIGLKTPKNMFLTKFYEIGHFWPNYRTFIFELFWSKNIFYSTKWPIWPIWTAYRLMWPILKEPDLRFCLQKNFKSCTTLNRSWDIFIYIFDAKLAIWRNSGNNRVQSLSFLIWEKK